MGSLGDIAMTPQTCVMARAGLGLSQSELGEAADVARSTLADYERQVRVPHSRTLHDIMRVLVAKGAIFLSDDGNGPGVRLRDVS